MPGAGPWMQGPLILRLQPWIGCSGGAWSAWSHAHTSARCPHQTPRTGGLLLGDDFRRGRLSYVKTWCWGQRGEGLVLRSKGLSDGLWHLKLGCGQGETRNLEFPALLGWESDISRKLILLIGRFLGKDGACGYVGRKSSAWNMCDQVLGLGRKQLDCPRHSVFVVSVTSGWFCGSTQTKVLVLLLFSCSVVSDSLWPHPRPSLSPGVCSNSHPLSRWCHPTISSSVVPFSSCPQSFPASGSFPVSRLLSSGGQSIGASASASVLPMNIQGWSFRIDWFDLLAVQGTLKSLLQHQFESINSSALSLLYGPTLTSIHDYWKYLRGSNLI